MIKLTIKYALFAGISTICNLSTQQLMLIFLSSLGFLKGFDSFNVLGMVRIDLILMTAIFIGTLVGLVIKYILDKKYIFNFEMKNKSENTGKFMLYSLMGVFTTLIYWAFEISFDAIFNSEAAKFIGALIGLTIGYVIKYNLDKRFVFNRK